MKKILVATDGSEYSERALIEAKKIAVCRGSKVTIINVATDLPAYVQGDHVDTTKESVIKHQNETLEEALIIFQDYSGEVDTISRNGKESVAIIKEAEEGDYDLIIMGSKGEGAFFRAILGSTSNNVLNHVKKNVLIIK